MIRIVIVDDHPIVSQGLAAVLVDHPRLEVVGTAAGLTEAVEVVSRTGPDVVLVDLDLGGDDGLDLLARLPAQVGRLVFTAHDGEERVVAALDAGARGYVLKGSPLADIVAAVERVHRGETYLDARVAGRVLSRVRGGRLLSARQAEVLRLVAEGLSNGQIASRTGLTERTVKFHVNAIFNKLGAENRAQAVALAAQRGLL
jgi:DNA-binding NarL/FixJ family response regulator